MDSFTIRYSDTDVSPFFGSFVFIRDIDPSQRNYTVTGLDPDTSYSFRVQAISVDRRGGSLSASVEVVTLPPGRHNYWVKWIKIYNCLIVNVHHVKQTIINNLALTQ